MLQQMLGPVQYQVSGSGPGGSSLDGQVERGLKAGGDSLKSRRCDKFGSRKQEGLSIVDMYSDMPTSHKR